MRRRRAGNRWLWLKTLVVSIRIRPVTRKQGFRRLLVAPRHSVVNVVSTRLHGIRMHRYPLNRKPFPRVFAASFKADI